MRVKGKFIFAMFIFSDIILTVNASMVGGGWMVVILFYFNIFKIRLAPQAHCYLFTSFVFMCTLRDKREPRKRAESPEVRLVFA